MKESMNNMEVRNINRQNIVDALLRERALTKAGISQTLGLSLATVNTLLKELLEEGLVEQGKELSSTGGRRPTLYQVVAQAKVAVGIALSAHHIRIACVNWRQDVVGWYREKILFEDTQAYWIHLRQLVLSFLESHQLEEEKLQGIGICLPAEIIPHGTMEEIIPRGIFASVDMQKVKEMYHCRVCLLDDMKAAAFSYVGSRDCRKRMVYLHLDQRIGGTIIADGSFWGLSNRAGAFGALLVGDGDIEEDTHESSRCFCHQKGSLQYYCSTGGIREKSGMQLKEFFQELEQKNPKCVDIWKEYKKYLLAALRNLRVIFDIDIMLGGELAPYLLPYRQELEEELSKHDIYGETCRYLLFSKGDEYDGAMGAGFIMMEKFQKRAESED